MRRVASGDDDAFAELFDRHAAVVLGMLVQMLRRRELAEEVLQETMLQAWSQTDRYRPERATVRGWLLMLARSRALDRLRSAQSRSRREETRADDPTTPTFERPQGTATLEKAERRELVLRALAAVDTDKRRCLELAFFQGLSHSQIADTLGQPMGTIKSRIRNGMGEMRQALGPYYKS